MAGKRTEGHRAHKRDERKPRVASDLKKLEQKYWRKDALVERMRKMTFTKKNGAEAERMGYTIKVDISGYPIGLV